MRFFSVFLLLGLVFCFPWFFKMVISPDRKDFSAIFNVIGRLCVGLSVFMLIPLFSSMIFKESSPFYDFLIGVLASVALGLLLMIIFPLKKELTWQHSFFIVSLGWVFASILGAIPFCLSGHWSCFLDAWFESMSGFATTGLVLVRDLDHLSFSHNIWRHLTMFVGGQGIILATLSVLSTARGDGGVGLYVGEARQEKIFPNIIATARFIWKVSLVYLFLGITVFSLILIRQGMYWQKALVQAGCLFFASFDTGGFAPQAQNIGYYHNSFLEIATMVFMILGALNFNLHFFLWHKSKKEIFRNFEVKIFIFTIVFLSIPVFFTLKGLGSLTVFRKGFYQIISAHTGCGFTNLLPWELRNFHPGAQVFLILAMGIGGAVCSTTGGVKLLRIGFLFKAVFNEIKRAILPNRAVYIETYHHLRDIVIEEKNLKHAFIFVSLYCLSYIAGGIAGIFYGYNPLFSFFESVSATANVGLSTGITSPNMPAGLKLIYIFQMWMGRLEFLSVFIAVGYVFSMLKKDKV